MSVTEPSKIPNIVSRHIGNLPNAIALVCIIGSESMANVIAFFTPGDGARDAEFRKALLAEDSYCEAVLSFDDVSEDDSDQSLLGRLAGLADELGVDRIVSMVARTEEGKILMAHDYSGLEYTLIEGVQTQLCRFSEIIDGAFYPKTGAARTLH